MIELAHGRGGIGVPKGLTGSPEGKREKLDAVPIVLDQMRGETDEKFMFVKAGFKPVTSGLRVIWLSVRIGRTWGIFFGGQLLDS